MNTGKLTCLGPCPAGEAAATGRPSAGDCAQLAEMRRSMASDGGASCAQMPPSYRKTCETQMAAGQRYFGALEQRCR